MALVERGDRAATVTTLEAFAKALKVTLAEFFAEDFEERRGSEKRDAAERLIEKLRARGPDVIAATERMLTVFDRLMTRRSSRAPG